MSKLSDFITQHERLFDNANKSIVEASFRTITKVYIDLALLKDTRMGLMISLSDKSDMQYLAEGLPRYNLRPNRKFTEVYPNFKVDELTLDKYYHDPEYSKRIFNYSPDTDFSIGLNSLIEAYVATNNRAGNCDPIDVVINAYPLTITTDILIYKKLLNAHHKGLANFNIVSVDPKLISATAWTSYSSMFIDDLQYALTDSNLYKVLFEQQKLLNTTIFAPYCCADNILDKWRQYRVDLTDKTTISDLFKVTEYLLSAFCYFSFIPFQIPVPEQE